MVVEWLHYNFLWQPASGDHRPRSDDDIPTFDIPIFTEEFLDHNKSVQIVFFSFFQYLSWWDISCEHVLCCNYTVHELLLDLSSFHLIWPDLVKMRIGVVLSNHPNLTPCLFPTVKCAPQIECNIWLSILVVDEAKQLTFGTPIGIAKSIWTYILYLPSFLLLTGISYLCDSVIENENNFISSPEIKIYSVL